MGIEIERRFLVNDPSFLAEFKGVSIVQGYLAKDHGGVSTRIRIAGTQAWLTLKSPRRGPVREEYEYAIPFDDAKTLIERHCGGRVVSKERYVVPFGGVSFEIDVFLGGLSGLVIAEVELGDPDQPLEFPPWLGTEITYDSRYGNRTLAREGLPTDHWQQTPEHLAFMRSQVRFRA